MVPIPNFVWYAHGPHRRDVVRLEQDPTSARTCSPCGSNPEAANVSGVNVAATTMLVFHRSRASCTAITGFIEAARIGANTPVHRPEL